MNKIDRRDAIRGMVTAGIAATFSLDTSAQQTQAPLAPAFGGKHQPVPLPFNAAKLTGISEKLITSHHDNNYVGAVKALNLVENHLAEAVKSSDIPAYIYGELKREELIRTGSVVMHEKYFANLGGDGKVSGAAASALKQWFGSYEAWEAEFKKIGNALSGGSGWAILAYNHHTKELHNYWAADHAHHPAFTSPLLVMDMYEHAYQMDYGAAAAKYIDAFFANINWDEVNRRVEAAKIA